MQNTNNNAQPAPIAQPQTIGGHLAQYAQAQAQKAQAQAQRLANAVYVLVKPCNANLQRTPAKGNTQAQTNAQYSAAILLQVYPLIATSGLTPQAQQASQQALLKAIYNLQLVSPLAPSKHAVQMQLPPK